MTGIGKAELEKPKNETNARRTKLKEIAMIELSNPNRCQALVTIVERATKLVADQPRPAKVLIDDLEAVLIGQNLRGRGRGQGPWFVGYRLGKDQKTRWSGASGFKKEMRDESHQIQHAIAGVVISFRYLRPAEWFVHLLEQEEKDDNLYEATFKVGRTLNDSNYLELPKKLRDAIGDFSCDPSR